MADEHFSVDDEGIPTPSNRSLENLSSVQLSLASKLVALAAPETSIHPLAIQSLAIRTERGERVGVIVGHNRFDLYTLTRLARQHHLDTQRLLANIEISRAFTCHQLHHRITTLARESTRHWSALYVLGLLDTFFDESVDYHEAGRLLAASLAELERLAREGLPILITVSLPKEPGRELLLRQVARGADEYWELAGDTPRLAAPRQLELPLRF